MLVMWGGIPGLGCQKTGFINPLLVFGYQCPTPGGGDYFIPVKGKYAKIAKGTAFSAFVLRSEGFGCIFNNRYIVGAGNPHNLVHPGGHTVQVHYNDGLWLFAR